MTGRRSESTGPERGPTARPPIEEVLSRHREGLLARAGVVGVAVGRADGEECLRVLVTSGASDLRADLPNRLEGYLVSVEETRLIRARERRDRDRSR